MSRLAAALALALSLPALGDAGPPHLDRAFIRGTQRELDDAAFDSKWKASLASPVIFIRSYPGAFHKLLAGAPKPPGAEGLCLGDAHPGNFGFLQVGGKTVFGFNDLDDSGSCPIAADALRYFTALRLFFTDADLFAAALDAYGDALKDPTSARRIDKQLEPGWKKVRANGLDKVAKGDKLGGEGIGALPDAERKAVLGAVAADPQLRKLKIIDVATALHEAGGSANLKRYWLLAERGGDRTVIELKTAAVPAVELGRAARKLSMDERLPRLKKAFWGSAPADDYFYTKVGGARFLVRDRFSKKSLDVLELKGKDLRHVLETQAGAMARVHAGGWQAMKKGEVKEWLAAQSKAQEAAWRAAYAAAKR